MDFMVEESYPCMSDGCDKVFHVKANLKKHAKWCRRRIIVACTAIKLFHANKISNLINRRVNRMKIGTSTADTMVLMLMHIMPILNSSVQYSKMCFLPTGKWYIGLLSRCEKCSSERYQVEPCVEGDYAHVSWSCCCHQSTRYFQHRYGGKIYWIGLWGWFENSIHQCDATNC